jgi:hypothetical protein
MLVVILTSRHDDLAEFEYRFYPLSTLPKLGTIFVQHFAPAAFILSTEPPVINEPS